MTLAAGLTRALERSGIPITGVSIGRESDRASWRVDFTGAATAKHKTDAGALCECYELATDTALAAEQAERVLAQKALVSLARVTWEHLPLTKPTWADFLARWKALYLG